MNIDPKEGRIIELTAVAQAVESQRNNALADHAATVGRLAVAHHRLALAQKRIDEQTQQIEDLKAQVEALKPKEA